MTGGDGRQGVGSEIGNEIAQLPVWAMVATVAIIAPLIAGISLRIDRLRTVVLVWLSQHEVLVRNALVDLPGGGGLGLDLNRPLVAVGLVPGRLGDRPGGPQSTAPAPAVRAGNGRTAVSRQPKPAGLDGQLRLENIQDMPRAKSGGVASTAEVASSDRAHDDQRRVTGRWRPCQG